MDSLTIYKASAGSGKTFTLAVEYIRRLVCEPAAVYSYREILAVTFTNKATTEMKDRIVEALYAIGHKLKSGNKYLDKLRSMLHDDGIDLNQDEIAERCRIALGNILHDYSRFRVETIDAFFQSIMRDLAHELGLAAGLQTDLDTASATSEAVEAIFDTLDKDERLRRQISRFVRERIESSRSWNVMATVKQFAKNIFNSSYQDAAPALLPLLADDEFVNTYREALDGETAEAMDRINSCMEQLEYDMQEMGLRFEDFSRGSIIASHLGKVRSGTLNDFGKTLQGYIDEPVNLLRKDQRKDARMQQAAEHVSEILRVLQQMEQSGAKRVNTVSLIKKKLNELRLLGIIDKEVNNLTLARGTFLLANTPQLLHRLVADGDTPFIYEKMGARLQHVMLDEFQDTSRLQWHNFRTLLDDNMDRGGSTLVVGDVKQSIYRWRDGDWRILHGLQGEMSRYSPRVEGLDTNYRSHSQIIDFNNMLYKDGAAEQLGLSDLYSDVVQKTTPTKQGGYVRLIHFTKEAKQPVDTIMRQMCDDIKHLNAMQVPYSQMAILIRSNSEEAVIANAFDTWLPGVPLVSNGVFRLGSSTAVKMIVDALRCLYDPADKATEACLRFSYHTQVLGLPPEPNMVFVEHSISAVDGFLAERERLLRMPLYDLVMHVVSTFSLGSLEGQAAYLLAFYDQLANFLSRRPASISCLLDYYDETMCKATVNGCEVDGVNVLTIHKSKGLEWNTVFVPFANWFIEEDRDMVWCSTHGVQPYSALPLVPVTLGRQMADSIFSSDYEEEHLQQRVDNLNLLYVATTRPGCNLMMWGYYSARLTAMGLVRNALNVEWQADESGLWDTYSIGSMTKHEKDDDPKDNPMHLDYTPEAVDIEPCPPLHSFMQSGAADRFLSPGEEPDEAMERQASYIEQGCLLHAVFEQLHTASDLDRVLASLSAQGLLEGSEMRHKVERLVRAGLANPQVAAWFAPGNQTYNECNILSMDADGMVCKHRPDRVIVSDSRITVVDYKFGKPVERHREQVIEYMDLLSSLYTRHTVEGYLWYVYQNNVERV